MHELSIAMNILEIVQDTCRKEGYSRIDAVRVKVGAASGVFTDALIFAFDCAKDGSMAEKARLDIDEVPLGGTCEACGADFSVAEPFVFHCPLCQSSSFQITRGGELEIVELEVDS